MEITKIAMKALLQNKGQIEGLPVNPRQWTKGEVQTLAASIKQTPALLEARGIIVYPHKDKYIILGGNMRYEALKALKETEAPCIVLPADLPLDTLKQIVIKDNGSFGAWDYDALGNEWDDLPLTEWGVPAWDTTDTEQEEGEPQGEAHEDDFDEEKDAVEARCVKGDVWLLGDHRLMCGDSTSVDDVDRLMQGEKADIAFCSTPYGIDGGGLRGHIEAKKEREEKYKNLYNEYDDNIDNWHSLIEDSYMLMRENSVYQFINIQLLSNNKRELLRWAGRHADDLCDMMIWDKGHGAPQMQDNILNNRMEFIYVFGGNGTRKLSYGNFHGNIDNVIDDVKKEQNVYASIHRAVFPIGLPAKILQINEKAQSVLDMFGGTGTTLIACEQLGRKCRMMELDPHYCDVILARWEKATGGKAQKVV